MPDALLAQRRTRRQNRQLPVRFRVPLPELLPLAPLPATEELEPVPEPEPEPKPKPQLNTVSSVTQIREFFVTK